MSNLYRIGVGIMMLNTKNQIFVAERKYPKNAWQMPQYRQVLSQIVLT